ncbi:MAG: ATP-binding cassette domain-containing protein, partial [Bowdeniella nasicola]|nr:ATP-binding cassette domain-containing protein [Bowdeniella nasicola]
MISAHDLSVRIGARELLRQATFHAGAGQRVALVGRNGAGKTTLTSLLAGTQAPDSAISYSGSITTRGQIGYLPQDSRTGDLDELAMQRVLSARGLGDLRRRIERAEMEMSTSVGARQQRAMERYARLDAQFTMRGGWAAQAEAASITANLGLDPTVLK